MAKFGLIEPFHIDNGQLDGYTPQECFTLGVEWQKYWQFALNHDTGLSLPPGPHLLNSANLQRVLGLLQAHSVPFTHRLVNDDWAEVTFGDLSPQGDDNGEVSA
jgi:hypothetical protein